MKRNKLLIALMVFAVVISCTAMLFACNTKAQDESKLIHVYFDNNDNSGAVEKVLKKEDISSLATPERTGYDFTGWTMDKDGTVELVIDSVEDGTTLYAQWKKKMYTIYFMLDEVECIKQVSVAYGEKVTAPTDEEIAKKLPQDKTFVGWDNFDKDAPITASKYIYALTQAVETTYTATFTDGDKFSWQTTGKAGETISAPLKNENPTKAGYTFANWQTASGVAYEEGVTFSANVTYLATWTLNTPTTPTLTGKDSIVYGESSTISATINNKVDGISYVIEWYENDQKLGSGETITLEELNAKAYHIRCQAYATDGTLKSGTANKVFDLNVEKATLTAQIDDITLSYGETLPSLDIKYTGFEYDDNASVLNLKDYNLQTSYNATSPVGEYYVTVSGITADNYQIVGTVGIEKNITAKINAVKRQVKLTSPIYNPHKVYDGSVYSETLDNTYFEGLIEGHTIAYTIATNSANKGTYADENLVRTFTVVDANQNDATGNYEVLCPAILQIDPADIAIEKLEDEISYNYDGKPHKAQEVIVKDLSSYTLQYAIGDGEYTDDLPKFTNAGAYTVNYRVSAGENYDILEGWYGVTINKAKLTIKASEQNTTYGAEFALDQTAYTIDGTVYDTINFSLSCDDYEVGKAVGGYPISVKLGENNNYDIQTEDNILYVAEATLVVKLKNAKIQYSKSFCYDTVEEGIDSFSGLYSKDSISQVIDITIGYTQGNAVGIYPISAYSVNTNYIVESINGTLTVGKYEMSAMIFTDSSPVYGDKQLPSFLLQAENLFYTEAEANAFESDVILTHDYIPYNEETGAYGKAGEYTVSASIKENSILNKNYNITFEKGSFNVRRCEIAISRSAVPVVYGEDIVFDFDTFIENKYLTVYVGEILDVDKKDVKFVTEYTKGCFGYGYTWTISFDNDNYIVTLDELTPAVLINPRTVKVTYTNNNIALGEEGSVLQVAIDNTNTSDLYTGDYIASAGYFNIPTDKETNGALHITSADGYAFSNPLILTKDGNEVNAYTFEFDITVTVKKIEIKHRFDNTTVTYNGKAQYPTLVFDDAEDAEKAEVKYTYNNNEYTQSGFSNLFEGAGEYTFTYTITHPDKSSFTSNPVTFTINKYTIRIALGENPDPSSEEYVFSVVYGDTFSISGNIYTIYGPKNDSNIASDLNLAEGMNVAEFLGLKVSVDYTPGETNAGFHDVDVSWNDDVNANINIHCNTKNKFYVSPRGIKIYGECSIVYGNDASTLTIERMDAYYAENENIVVENAESFITISPNNYTAGDWNNEHDFELKAESTNKNYVVENWEEVQLFIDSRTITITANNLTVNYGEDLNFTCTIDKLIGNDKLLVGYKQSNGDSFNQPSVGTYDIVPYIVEGEDSYKYNINLSTYTNGTLTVNKAELTVALSEQQTITYGDDMPTYTATYTGFAYGETASVLGGTLTISCDYATAKKVGTFDVVASGLTSSNYNITYIPSTLVVNKANLTITVNAHDAITYGDDVPTFTVSYDGFKLEENESALAGTLTISCDYADDKHAGEFSVTASGLTSSNYNITYVGATLVVNKAKLAITANAHDAITYGDDVPTFSYTATGFVNGDTTSVLANKVGFTTNYTKGSNAGGYTYNVTCAELANYDVTIGNDQTLVVNKKQATITGDKVYETDYTGNTIVLEDVVKNISTDNTDKPITFTTVVKIYNTDTVVDTIIDGGVYSVTYSLPETTNFLAASLPVTLKVKFVAFNSTLYTLEDAVATANKNNGGTLLVQGNGFISQSISIPSGITLILPCDGGYSTTAGEVTIDDDYSNEKINEHAYKTRSAKFTLTIPQNITLTIDGGNIIVAGKLGKNGSGMEGMTSGSYSQITNNGDIIVNSGILDVRGYVMTDGNGKATFNGGSVYSPFVVRDFKGGTYTVYKAWVSVDFLGLLSNKVAPFSEYEMINIQCISTYNYGATLNGYCDLYAGEQHNITTVDMISSSGVIRLSQGASVTQVFNKSKGKSTLTFIGNITIGSLTIDAAGTTVKMSETFFPIPWTYDINVGNGTTATTLAIANDYKVLPGCTISIKKNATVNASSGNVIVYSNWTDDNSIQKYPTTYGTAGKLELDGGTLNAYKFGGIIYATSNGGTFKASKDVSISSYEHNNSDRYKVTEAARFEDGTTLSKNTTYTYNGTSWSN